MLFTKLLDIMNKYFATDTTPDLYENLSKLNPEKFYLENVRSIVGVSQIKAQEICEIAVEDGFLIKGFDIDCPDGAVGLSVNNLTELPETVVCWEMVDGEYEEREYPTRTLEKQIYYRLGANAESQSNSSASKSF